MKIIVNGAVTISEVPGLDAIAGEAELVCAPDAEHLAAALPGAEILLGWNFRGRDLPDAWNLADNLKWIHWCGAGVDAVMFKELADSDVMLSNSRGIFDRAMAEYVAGYVISEMKLFRDTWSAQERRFWDYRRTHNVSGTRAVVFGVGSIGREVAKVLNALGVIVSGVGRSSRDGDADFSKIYSQNDAQGAIADAEWVIGVMPLTATTTDYFDADLFAAMKPGSRFINIGRGASVVEPALISALESGHLAGAMLDVFQNEPLEEDDPIWQAPNIMISPHMSGDYLEAQPDMVQLFLENFARYRAGEPLLNLVDKSLGFVRS
ncbi:MAG: D-2-hydroxyacid dehydrogenase [Alphaproteobacteria bacterium]|nr:D-2-hydroxyacid dehydrogenase [Alphaproteobacteria bacterium]